MGALHEGHASLMRAARERVADGPVVVSIFVNPLQFGAGEDLDRYPRTLDDDLELCEREGVDIVFAPSVEEVYPGGEPQVTVDPARSPRARGQDPARPLPRRADRGGQAVRPGPAGRRGVRQKDYQQLALIRRMVSTSASASRSSAPRPQREPDGLALSSRNRYLDAEQRREAVGCSRTLRGPRGAPYGADVALGAARAELRTATVVDLDYLVITAPDWPS
jgi:pantoate--beta-alanine ligase